MEKKKKIVVQSDVAVNYLLKGLLEEGIVNYETYAEIIKHGGAQHNGNNK